MSSAEFRTSIVRLLYSCWALGVATLPVAADHTPDRYVPQLGLTDLQPSKVAFDPSGSQQLLVVNSAGRIDLFDISKPGRPIKTSEVFADARDAAFDPIGGRIASAGEDGTLRLWTLDGQQDAGPFRGHQGAINDVAFSPSGDRLVSAGNDGTVRLWNLDGEPAVSPFAGHRGAVTGVAFNPAGDRIASAGSDGTIWLWTLDGLPVVARISPRTTGRFR